MTKLTYDTRQALGFYRHYKNGFFPEPGGALDQCATFLDAMSVIDSGMMEAEDG